MTKPLPLKNRGAKINPSTYNTKFRCPKCGGIDTRRYSARSYIYCFVCDIEIPYPENERFKLGK